MKHRVVSRPHQLNIESVVYDLARRALVRRLAMALAAAGIPAMPLKGALFAYWVYEEPSERLGGDIDLLVPEAEFAKAIHALGALRFAPQPPHGNANEITLCAARMPIEIDLHRALFAPGRYLLPTADLFARGSENHTLFSAPLVIPNPYDAYAHVIGHAASEHLQPIPLHNRRDLELLAAHFSLDPQRCAAHLEDTGLARAARYTLGLIGPVDPFASEVLRCLRSDPLGAAFARVACMLTGRFAPETLTARIAGHLTDSSLPQAVIAVTIALVARLRVYLGSSPR